jgi:hypothetical protein
MWQDNQMTNFWSEEIETSIEKQKSQAARCGNETACGYQRNKSERHQNKAQLSKHPSK